MDLSTSSPSGRGGRARRTGRSASVLRLLSTGCSTRRCLSKSTRRRVRTATSPRRRRGSSGGPTKLPLPQATEGRAATSTPSLAGTSWLRGSSTRAWEEGQRSRAPGGWGLRVLASETGRCTGMEGITTIDGQGETRGEEKRKRGVCKLCLSCVGVHDECPLRSSASGSTVAVAGDRT